MNYTEEQIAEAMEGSPALWILKHKIKNESGVHLDFTKRAFLWDIYNDISPKQAFLKPPQIGATVMNTIKALYVAKKLKRQIIYTLPTQGDVSAMVGGSFNRIIAQNQILKEWVKDHDTIEQKSVGDSMIFYRGCVDEQTEILTEKGWCKLGEINIGDKLPTLNILTNAVEMDNVLNISVFEVPEKKMVRIKSRQIDQLVTLDHRCVVSKRTFAGNKGPLRIVRAHELVGKTGAYIPVKHIKYSQENAYTGESDFYRILGWVIGDGSYWTKRDKYTTKKGPKVAISKKVCIIQSKLNDKLESDLEAAGIGYYKKPHNKTCWRYELNAKASVAIRNAISCKQLTYELVFNATPSERESLYEGLMMSDGNNYKDTTFYQNQGITVDAFQALMVLLGKTTSTTQREKKVAIHIKTTDYAQVFAKYEPYQGKAWCPTTRNGTIFIRRNGIVSVTGQTWTNKQAMMIPSGLNIHDEVDASNLEVITQYETRLQAQEDGGWRWYFSHPSLEGHGVDVYWQKSDMKEWHITCPHCEKDQVLTFPENIDMEKEVYVCSLCSEELSTDDRIHGYWANKDGVRWEGKIEGGYEFSGWHVSQLMLHNKSASDIVKAFTDPLKTKQYFYNYVLGLPYEGGDNRITVKEVQKNCIDVVNDQTSTVVIGLDTGLGIHMTLGNKDGIFYYEHITGIEADKDPYTRVEQMLLRFPKSIVMSDQGGDLIGIRKLQAKYPGRVFLCYYRKDRKNVEIVDWGEADEYGKVTIDRNRTMTLLVEQLKDRGRIVLNGTPEEWKEFAEHFANMYREEITSTETPGKDDRRLYGAEYVWKRKGPDHFAHSMLYTFVGLLRYSGGMAKIVDGDSAFGNIPKGQMVNEEAVVSFVSPADVKGMQSEI